jgi:hypothetical protein
VPSPRKRAIHKGKDAAQAQSKVNSKPTRAISGIGHRKDVQKGTNSPEVKVNVRLLPETRLLVALANEEIEARRQAGQTDDKIWKDCQRAPLAFVKRGFKRLLNA